MHLTRPPITDRKVRFAVIGCGRIAQNHFESITKHSERSELVAICDTDPAA
ncbi:Gfo/Idh/MocA family oxidoreductase, partial [Rubrivivax rivuli]